VESRDLNGMTRLSSGGKAWMRTTMRTQTTDEGIALRNHRLAKWSMYALIAFPIVDFALRHDMGKVGIGLIWDKVIFAILALTALVRWRRGIRPAFFRWQRFGLWFVVYAAALCLSSFQDFGLAFAGLQIDVYYLLFAFLIPFVVGPEDVRPLLHAAAVVAILIAIHALYQYAVKVPIPANWVDVGEHVRTRAFSVIASPNELGAYMALNIPLLTGLGLYERDKWRKWFYRVGVVCCAGAFLCTFTRGAWISLFLALVVMAVLVERRFLILIAVFCVAGFFVPAIHHRITDLFSPIYWLKSTTQFGRLQRWLMAFDVMSRNPLFGKGLGQYGGAIAEAAKKSIYADNYYAKTLAETGLVGLVLFLSMHLALLMDLFRHTVFRYRARLRIVFIGGVTGIIAMLIHNSMENVFEYGPSVLAYFILATLLLIWSTGILDESKTDH
jgi:O-antigen ligase